MLTIYSVTAKQESHNIKTDGYTAKLSRDGYLSGISINGQEFLSAEKNIPGGFYLCAGYISKGKLISTNDNNYVVQNDIANITYKFNKHSITIKLDNVKKDGSLYMLINKKVDQAKYLPNSETVPVITDTPANAKCSQIKWQNEKSFLSIDGGSRIWGPWHEHQVWELKIKQNQTYTITLKPGTENSATTSISNDFFTYNETTVPPQIPLCMLGDSITWAGEGDYWRKFMLNNIPQLSFIGTHSGCLGYSHAGEGGNNTRQVLKRIKSVPSCPYYMLLIGTNDNSINDKDKLQSHAEATAERIINIVDLLLEKKHIKKVFLCSILPCHTDNPLRFTTNKETNKILRKRIKKYLQSNKVVWVELEEPILATDNWQDIIPLHPTIDGYKLIANITAKAILDTLKLNHDNLKSPTQKPDTGVRIINLIKSKRKETTYPVIAGWYTLSCTIKEITAPHPEIVIQSINNPADFSENIPVSASNLNKRITFNFFTGYEGYGYTRARLRIKTKDCKIKNILLEKRRPSGKASCFNDATIYIDQTTKPSPGELIE